MPALKQRPPPPRAAPAALALHDLPNAFSRLVRIPCCAQRPRQVTARPASRRTGTPADSPERASLELHRPPPRFSPALEAMVALALNCTFQSGECLQASAPRVFFSSSVPWPGGVPLFTPRNEMNDRNDAAAGRPRFLRRGRFSVIGELERNPPSHSAYRFFSVKSCTPRFQHALGGNLLEGIRRTFFSVSSWRRITLSLLLPGCAEQDCPSALMSGRARKNSAAYPRSPIKELVSRPPASVSSGLRALQASRRTRPELQRDVSFTPLAAAGFEK